MTGVKNKDGVDISADATYIANINPFRYRGYYYDEEIDMYYLQSRYYDADIARFICADEARFLGVAETMLGYNLFVYCENTSVNALDFQGTSLIKVSNLGYYNTEKRLFYFSINAPQRSFGYCDLYDRLAGAVGIYIAWLTVYFSYNGKTWRIECWKGTYGNIYGFDVSTGCEIGVYYRKWHYFPGWYQCADNSNTLKMEMGLLK